MNLESLAPEKKTKLEQKIIADSMANGEFDKITGKHPHLCNSFPKRVKIVLKYEHDGFSSFIITIDDSDVSEITNHYLA